MALNIYLNQYFNTTKGVTTRCISPIGYSVLLPWIQTFAILRTWIVFNWRKICEPIDLWKKESNEFKLFRRIFLRNWSLSNARWFLFYSKKCNFCKGNMYLTENWLSKNTVWCKADNHNYTLILIHFCQLWTVKSRWVTLFTYLFIFQSQLQLIPSRYTIILHFVLNSRRAQIMMLF